jgi:hypothetical protein
MRPMNNMSACGGMCYVFLPCLGRIRTCEMRLLPIIRLIKIWAGA